MAKSAKKGKIIIPAKLKPSPTPAEISAAAILANYFEANVIFVERTSCKTPDFHIKNRYWELKSITGTGKRNIQHAVSKALKQSENIIIDARASKLHITTIRHKLQSEYEKNRHIKELLLIDKTSKTSKISK